MAQKSDTSSDIVVAPTYAITDQSLDIGQLLKDNLGSGGLSPFDLDRVKIPGGGSLMWTIPSIDGETESKELFGIIAAWADKRSFWAKSMDESGGGSPPDCSSEDGEVGFGYPIGHPDLDESELEHRFNNDGSEHLSGGPFECMRCPLSQFGSGKGQAQACKSMKFVFLISPERLLPMLLSVPPSSLRAFRQYMLQLASSGARYNNVVTKFTLEKEQKPVLHSRLVASKASSIDPALIPQIDEYTRALKPLISRIGTQRMDYES